MFWAQTVYSRATEDDAGSGHYKYPYSRLQHIGFFILFFFPALALVVFALRIYGRFSTKQYGYGTFSPRQQRFATKCVLTKAWWFRRFTHHYSNGAPPII